MPRQTMGAGGGQGRGTLMGKNCEMQRINLVAKHSGCVGVLVWVNIEKSSMTQSSNTRTPTQTHSGTEEKRATNEPANPMNIKTFLLFSHSFLERVGEGGAVLWGSVITLLVV